MSTYNTIIIDTHTNEQVWSYAGLLPPAILKDVRSLFCPLRNDGRYEMYRDKQSYDIFNAPVGKPVRSRITL